MSCFHWYVVPFEVARSQLPPGAVNLKSTVLFSPSATVKEATTKFDKAEAIFHVKCDVHPWMSAYMAVFTHPFFSATGPDGKFTISGLDPGTYEITAWHERLGTQTASVTVGGSDTKTQNFKFTLPAK